MQADSDDFNHFMSETGLSRAEALKFVRFFNSQTNDPIFLNLNPDEPILLHFMIDPLHNILLGPPLDGINELDKRHHDIVDPFLTKKLGENYRERSNMPGYYNN